jgi:hypothetical protein
MATKTDRKQWTDQTVPDGYWVDARGALLPETLIKARDRDRDALVGQIVEQAKALHVQLGQFKQAAFDAIEAFEQRSAADYGARIGGKKGNIVLHSFDGRYRIQRAIADKITFDERLQTAKVLIDQCMQDWTKDASPEVRSLIDEAFQVDKTGSVNTQRILRLRRLNIRDGRWQQAMTAIQDAIHVIESQSYLRLYQRKIPNAPYQPISLDIAGIGNGGNKS